MENKVLYCLFKETGLTNYDIAKRTKINLTEVDAKLNLLQNRGLVCEIKLNEELLAYFITDSGKNYIKVKTRPYDAFITDELEYPKTKVRRLKKQK